MCMYVFMYVRERPSNAGMNFNEEDIYLGGNCADVHVRTTENVHTTFTALWNASDHSNTSSQQSATINSCSCH